MINPDLAELLGKVEKEREHCNDYFLYHPAARSYSCNYLKCYLVLDSAGAVFPEECHRNAKSYDKQRKELDNRIYSETIDAFRDELAARDPNRYLTRYGLDKKFDSFDEVLGLRILSAKANPKDELLEAILNHMRKLTLNKYAEERKKLFELALGIYDKWISELQQKLKKTEKKKEINL